jgi:hypothetical protein
LKGDRHLAYLTPEQIAAAVLIPFGFILVNKTLLPYSFTDKEGTTFNAMADFYHAELDLWVEIKCGHLNGKTSVANAKRAYERLDPAKLARYASHCQITTQWKHSSVKHALVQSTIGAPQYAIVFTKQPDHETLIRIIKQGIQAYSLDRFASLIKLQIDCQ